MKIFHQLLFSLLVLVVMTVFIPSSGAQTVGKKLKPSSRSGLFVPTSFEEAEQLEALFASVLSGYYETGAWKAAGFKLEQLDGGIITIREKKNRGHGSYVFRPGNNKPVFLQAPHRFFDKNTGKIVSRLFKSGLFQGVATNTKHRYHPSVPKGKSDLAHMNNSPFTAHGQAIARVYPEAVIVQIHGFSNKKKRRLGGAAADLIISSGTRWPSAIATSMANCLVAGRLGVVQLYPIDVQELGGTTNKTGRALRAMGFPGFIHIEMSSGMRKRLMKENEVLEKMARCLVSS
jgi:hypothetical protein